MSREGSIENFDSLMLVLLYHHLSAGIALRTGNNGMTDKRSKFHIDSESEKHTY